MGGIRCRVLKLSSRAPLCKLKGLPQQHRGNLLIRTGRIAFIGGRSWCPSTTNPPPVLSLLTDSKMIHRLSRAVLALCLMGLFSTAVSKYGIPSPPLSSKPPLELHRYTLLLLLLLYRWLWCCTPPIILIFKCVILKWTGGQSSPALNTSS